MSEAAISLVADAWCESGLDQPGGETEPHNLALVCWFHHHVIHEQQWRLEPLGAGHFLLRSPTGDLHEFRPPRLDLLTKQAQLNLA